MATDLVLTHATPAEIQQHLSANSIEWRGPLSTEAYFRREAHLSDQDLTRDGGLLSWVLVRTRPDGTREALCSCETLRKRALLALASSGEVRDVLCYGVASVFTLPEHRRRGYAGVMFEELGKWVDAEGRGKGGFSALWSDIGKDFYARRGWAARESAHLQLLVGGEEDGSGGDRDGVRLLRADDLAGLCERDEVLVRSRLVRLAGEGRNAVAICPDLRTLHWRLARQEFIGRELLGKVPEVHGALVTTSSGKDVWCLWTRMWQNLDATRNQANTMHILRLVVDDEEYDGNAATEACIKTADPNLIEAVAKLLSTAVIEARRWNLGNVQIWNPSSTTLAAARLLERTVDVTHREQDSISSLRWCDKDMEELETSLVWVANEKYAWC